MAIQSILRDRFLQAQTLNPRYSLRAYARKVGVHVGALSSILNGRRNVSRKLAERIALRLLLDPQERAEILMHFPERVRRKRRLAAEDSTVTTAAEEKRYLQLSAAQFKTIAEWEHLAVLSLVRCQGFQSSEDWVAERLGITVARARLVTSRLFDLGLLQKNEKGKWERSSRALRTTDDSANVSIQKNHEQTLELAKESLVRDDVTIRDFTSITLAIDPKKLSMAKEAIRKFQDELSDLLEAEDRTEVYRLSMQLFPLSKPKGNS